MKYQVMHEGSCLVRHVKELVLWATGEKTQVNRTLKYPLLVGDILEFVSYEFSNKEDADETALPLYKVMDFEGFFSHEHDSNYFLLKIEDFNEPEMPPIPMKGVRKQIPFEQSLN